MASVNSKTVRTLVNSTSPIAICTNGNPSKSLYIGQIDIVNLSAVPNTIDLLFGTIDSYGTFQRITIEGNFSRYTDERKIPYEVLPGSSILARLGSANAGGMVCHVSYMWGD